MDTLAFISKYEDILKAKRIPKMQFYKDCGITDAAVSQWRTGKTNPAMTTISRISEYLGVSVAYLLGEGQKENPTESGEVDFSDMELLAKFKAADETTQELIRRALGLK